MDMPTSGETDMTVTRTLLLGQFAPRSTTMESPALAAGRGLLLAEHRHGHTFLSVCGLVVDGGNSRALLRICRTYVRRGPQKDLRERRVSFLLQNLSLILGLLSRRLQIFREKRVF